MSGDVEAEKFFFEYEALGGGEIIGRFSDGGDLTGASDRGGGGGFLGGFVLGEHVEEGVLAGGFVAGVGGDGGHGSVDAVEELLARGAAEVEGTGLREMFEDALVDGPAIDAGDHVVKVFEGTVGVALGNDFLRSEFADAFHAGEAEADGGGAAIRWWKWEL